MNAQSTKRDAGKQNASTQADVDKPASESRSQVKEKMGKPNFRRTRLEEFESLRERASGSVFLVEGKHDVAKMQAVGFQGNFVTCDGNSERITEKVGKALDANGGGNKVLILTDFDDAGEELRRRHAAFLADQGFDADVQFGRRLKALLGFTTVEEIERKLIDLKQKGELNGKNVR